MKKIIFMLFIIAFAIRCSNQVTETPLINDLVVYTYKQNDSIYKGVKYIASDEVIINPDTYRSIEADSSIIKVTDENNRIWIYNHKGTPIGGMSFDNFTKIKFNDTKGYYIGTDYKKKYYYFNRTKTFLSPSHCFVNQSAICLVVNDKIIFYNHEGDFLWKTPSKGTYLIETKKDEKATCTIALPNSNNGYVIYDVEGKQFETVSPEIWKWYQKKFTTQQSVSDFTYVVIENT